MRVEEIRRYLASTNGTGLFHLALDAPPELRDTYQLLVVNWQVVAVTRSGEYQPRHIAEVLLKEALSGNGTLEWNPFRPYYPPLHLMFFIPLPLEDVEGEGAGKKEEMREEEAR